MKYKALVACGTGGVTSTHVAQKLKKELKERGYSVSTNQCRIQDIGSNLDNVDVIVTTSQVHETFDVPMFKGIAFLTGVGTKPILDDIEEVLRNKNN